MIVRLSESELQSKASPHGSLQVLNILLEEELVIFALCTARVSVTGV
jgi:hypothetical protein